MQPKKHLSLTAKLLITLGILILSFILFRATQILLDYQNFRRNEKAIADLVSEISRQTSSTKIKEDKYCQEIHQKYSEGPKSCYVYSSLVYPYVDISNNDFITKINQIVGKKHHIRPDSSNDYWMKEDKTLYYDFTSSKQECDLAYRFYTSDNPASKWSGYGEGFTGLVATISCGQGVKWAYYPLQ